MADEVVDTPFGKFLVNPAECIGSTVKAGTVWDGPGFLQVIAREYGEIGTADVTILDIGAHLGDWAIWLAGQGAWRVVAVEPAPVMLRYLKANLDLNKDHRVGYTGAPLLGCADRVIVLPVAAFSERRMLHWTKPYDPRDSGGAALSGATETRDDGAVTIYDDDVLGAPLDDYALLYGSRVSLIKVDAQGADFRALVGLTRTIERDRPVIVFEWEQDLALEHGDRLSDVLAWLTVHRYDTIEWPSHPHNFLAIPAHGGTRL